MPSERVRVEVVRVRLARAQPLRGVGEVHDRLALDLRLVAAKTPVAQMKGLVNEHERCDGALPSRNVRPRDAECSFADQRREDGEIAAQGGIRALARESEPSPMRDT
jgi:hypothetical protein